jgi:hypothetical protein
VNAPAKKRRNDWLAWVAIGIVLPVLYVLSLGPVAYLIDQGILSHNDEEYLVAGFYRPLDPIFGPDGPLWDLGQSYLDLFRKP